jgi:excisionase family DNA binding protein
MIKAEDTKAHSGHTAFISSRLAPLGGKSGLPLAISVPAAAKLAGVSRSTLYTEMAAGRLAFAKVGKRRLIPMEALLEWLQAATTEVQ